MEGINVVSAKKKGSLDYYAWRGLSWVVKNTTGTWILFFFIRLGAGLRVVLQLCRSYRLVGWLDVSLFKGLCRVGCHTGFIQLTGVRLLSLDNLDLNRIAAVAAGCVNTQLQVAFECYWKGSCFMKTVQRVAKWDSLLQLTVRFRLAVPEQREKGREREKATLRGSKRNFGIRVAKSTGDLRRHFTRRTASFPVHPFTL